MPARAVLAALLALFLVPAAHTTLGQQSDLPRTTKPAYGNVESQLSDLVQQAVRGGIAASGALAAQAPVSDDDRVAVTIYLTGDPGAVVRALERRGAVIANVDTGLIEAYIDLLDIPDASDLPGVTRVVLIRPPMPLGRPRDVLSAVGKGDVVSEAVTVHNAARYHDAGITGRGVKVGVIDGGFIDLRQIQTDGELPPNIRARCYSRVGRFNSRLANCELDTEHGTAVAEALLDVAPGVTLYISNPQSFTDLRRTMRWMANQGVKIINHSVGWVWNGPGDGTTVIANSPLRTASPKRPNEVCCGSMRPGTGRATAGRVHSAIVTRTAGMSSPPVGWSETEYGCGLTERSSFSCAGRARGAVPKPTWISTCATPAGRPSPEQSINSRALPVTFRWSCSSSHPPAPGAQCETTSSRSSISLARHQPGYRWKTFSGRMTYVFTSADAASGTRPKAPPLGSWRSAPLTGATRRRLRDSAAAARREMGASSQTSSAPIGATRPCSALGEAPVKHRRTSRDWPRSCCSKSALSHPSSWQPG